MKKEERGWRMTFKEAREGGARKNDRQAEENKEATEERKRGRKDDGGTKGTNKGEQCRKKREATR